MNFTHLFFDLDRTLWDLDRNSFDTLQEIFHRHRLNQKGFKDFDEFYNFYKPLNNTLWEDYRNGSVSKEYLRVARFSITLQNKKINNSGLAETIAKEYVEQSPLKTNLLPHAIETLEYLNGRYRMSIITNGFAEVQHRKVEACSLSKYFEAIYTSEEAGVTKPDKNIFLYALNKSAAQAEQSLMIGDDLEVDIQGANNAGMKTAFINFDHIIHNGAMTFEVFSLKELQAIL